MRVVRTYAIVGLISLSTASFSYGNISGTITDTLERTVPVAVVTFTEAANPSRTYSTVADAGGNYRIGITASVNEDTDVPELFLIGQNYPNPFNPSTTISFALPAAGNATLAVFDITGRKVREIVNGHLSAGPHAAVWNGRDSSGRAVSSGVYFSRLTLNGKTQQRTVCFYPNNPLKSASVYSARRPLPGGASL